MINKMKLKTHALTLLVFYLASLNGRGVAKPVSPSTSTQLTDKPSIDLQSSFVSFINHEESPLTPAPSLEAPILGSEMINPLKPGATGTIRQFLQLSNISSMLISTVKWLDDTLLVGAVQNMVENGDALILILRECYLQFMPVAVKQQHDLGQRHLGAYVLSYYALSHLENCAMCALN